jgi:predicted peptidase
LRYRARRERTVRVKPILPVVASVFAFSLFVSPARGQDGDFEMQKSKKFERTITRTLSTRYLLFLPKGCDAKSPVRWPLMLFLHGAGERGANLQKVAVHGPPKIVKRRPDFPFIVVSPQCPDGEIWSNETLLGLLDEIIATQPVDTNRIYLTGLSMGGYGTWSLGLQAPERFAAIAPVCGGGDPIRVLLASPAKTKWLKSMGVWAFHGAKDPVVKLEESQRMVDALKKAGVQDVELTVYPDAEHDSWTATYDNEKLYEWFLQHDRKTEAESSRTNEGKIDRR